jgi:hypothetical protein
VAAWLSAVDSAQHHLTQSVTLLRKAGTQDQLPGGLLHRAALWRQMLSFNRDPAGSASVDADSDALPAGSRLNVAELLANAERDLSEAETIAERGSMLIWQIEAALERSQLYLALASVNSVSACFPDSETDENTEAPRTQSDWLKLAREKLDETKRLISQTEKPYEPHVPDWEDWEPPEYVGVFQPGDIVGYHRRDHEIDMLEAQITALGAQLDGDKPQP